MAVLKLSIQNLFQEITPPKAAPFEAALIENPQKSIIHLRKNLIFPVIGEEYFISYIQPPKAEAFCNSIAELSRNMYYTINKQLVFFKWQNKYIVLILYLDAGHGYGFNCFAS